MMQLTPYTTDYALGEFSLHGELQLQERLKDAKLHTIFDVGANVGEWTRMVRSYQPEAHIHTFEIMPEPFEEMLFRDVVDELVHPNSFGLSDKTEFIPVNCVPGNSRVTTSVLSYHHDTMTTKNSLVVKGSEYCVAREVRFIDFLKLDCEGHEYRILQGLKDVFAANAVSCVQFEYGLTNILTRHLLLDFYTFFTEHNFVVGKLTPEGVEFKDYHLLDETFQGPDYVAVNRLRPELIELVRR